MRTYNKDKERLKREDGVLATEMNTMNTKNSIKGKSEQQPKIKVKIPLPIPPTEELVKDPVIAGHIEQLKQVVGLLDEVKRKADEANNAVVGLVKIITAFHF